jgi:hypothetical protein
MVDLQHMLTVVVMIVGDDLQQVFGGGTFSKISATTRVCSVCHKLQHQSCNSSLVCKGVGTFTFFPIRVIKGDRCLVHHA